MTLCTIGSSPDRIYVHNSVTNLVITAVSGTDVFERFVFDLTDTVYVNSTVWPILADMTIDATFLDPAAYGGRYYKVDVTVTGDGTVEIYRSAERRVGKERVRRCRSRWSPYH
jgi:hypothetical protein